ncbi:MAG: metal ABC transporter ATP-binding protein [Myxococcales bacterium]|nr:metal ABC transporter ATP-binding protein [Myxococcales bacterium]USN49915.1 MAG: metal ABC transporter ATP-binding protein [Myxococcales bacterium]
MNKIDAVCAKNLWVSFGSNDVLHDLSFSINQGDIAAIIGPNGSGKTTLLKAILGLIPIKKGSIKILGKAIKDARKEIAYVPQRFNFDRSFPLTVLEFLQLSHPNCSKEKIIRYLDHLGSANTIHKKLGDLSGGQLQRVLIERAMLSDPKILFLDEPSAGIDVGGEHSFYELILHLHKEHKSTVIMVSHELDVVASFANFVLCLKGNLICTGKPQHVLTEQTIKSLFGKETVLYHHRNQ